MKIQLYESIKNNQLEKKYYFSENSTQLLKTKPFSEYNKPIILEYYSLKQLNNKEGRKQIINIFEKNHTENQFFGNNKRLFQTKFNEERFNNENYFNEYREEIKKDLKKYLEECKFKNYYNPFNTTSPDSSTIGTLECIELGLMGISTYISIKRPEAIKTLIILNLGIFGITEIFRQYDRLSKKIYTRNKLKKVSNLENQFKQYKNFKENLKTIEIKIINPPEVFEIYEELNRIKKPGKYIKLDIKEINKEILNAYNKRA